MYVHLGCQVLLVISSLHTCYGPSHHPHRQCLPLVLLLPSPWPCPLPGFRLMTSDSPLRGASCLQSAVRLLVIIFQSVTLVSALWRCEEERGQRSWLAGWLKQSGCDARWWAPCVCLCLRVCVWIEVAAAAAMEKGVAVLCSPSRVFVLKRHCVHWMCFCLQLVMFFTLTLPL